MAYSEKKVLNEEDMINIKRIANIRLRFEIDFYRLGDPHWNIPFKLGEGQKKYFSKYKSRLVNCWSYKYEDFMGNKKKINYSLMNNIKAQAFEIKGELFGHYLKPVEFRLFYKSNHYSNDF